MEKREARLSAYGRYLELEGQIPEWQFQLEERKEELKDAKAELNYQKVQLLSAQNPDFLRRLFGKWEAKVEKAQEEVRAASAEYEKQKWEIAQLETVLAEGKAEFDRLALELDDYRQLIPLEKEEGRYLAPALLSAADRCLKALEAAAPWVRRDARTTRVGSSNRRMEFLARAQDQAELLKQLLSLLAESPFDLGGYLKDPDYYIRGVTSEYAQVDRLNNAIDQVRSLKKQISRMGW